jgi:hypothetical protein
MRRRRWQCLVGRMEPGRPRILDSVLSRAAVVRVRNVLNPLLWLTAVVTPTSLLFGWAAGFESFAGLVLLALGCLPVIATLVAFAVFAVVDADRLQSEEFQLHQQTIKLIEKSGKVLNIDAVPSSEEPEQLPPASPERLEDDP